MYKLQIKIKLSVIEVTVGTCIAPGKVDISYLELFKFFGIAFFVSCYLYTHILALI